MDLGELLNPTTEQEVQSGPGQDTFTALRDKWTQHLSDPTVQGALLSIGGAAAQPRQWGQSPLAGFMSALGAGGDSVRTSEALDLKQQEAESKQGLRESQSQLAEARAGTAGAHANTAASRLELQRQQLENASTRSRLSNVIRFQNLYQQEVKSIREQNRKAELIGGVQTPIPTFEEWTARNPLARTLLGMEGESGGTPPVVSGNEASLPTATPGEKSRAPGRYQTPKGPMTWTGKEWVP